MLNGLKWIWVAVVAGIPLSLAAATLFRWLTTGEKVLVSRQAVKGLLSYWPLNGEATGRVCTGAERAEVRR